MSKPDPFRTLKRRIATNRAPCNAPHCRSDRHGVSELCLPHLRARRTHGHPLGKHIPAGRYAIELRDVERLFREQAGTHEGTRVALAFLNTWLQRAARGDSSVTAQAEFARLARHGVTAPRILAELAAIYTYSRRNQRQLPDDMRLDFAMANAILRLAPREVARVSRWRGHTHYRYVAAPRAERQSLGSACRITLVAYLASVAAALDEQARARALAQQSLAVPFPSLSATPTSRDEDYSTA